MRILFRWAVIVFALDQVIKWLVLSVLDLASRGEIDVMPPLLTLRMAWNYGINFGLLQGHSDAARQVLISVALVIVVFVLWWAWREKLKPLGMACAGVLIGGALGNVVDRMVYGAVADFLNMSCCGIENPFAFNVADVAIFAGALGLVFFADGKKGS